jgi:hypothetical protein
MALHDYAVDGNRELERSILAHYTLVCGIDPKEVIASGKTGR